MNRELRVKGIIIAIGVIICLYLVYPTVRWGTYNDEQRSELAGDIAQDKLGKWKEEEMQMADNDVAGHLALSAKKWLQGDRDRVLNLGLDLQGGLYVVLEVDMNDAIRVQNQNIRERIKDALQDKKIDFELVSDTGPSANELTFKSTAEAKQAATALRADLDFANVINIPEDPQSKKFKVSLKGNYIAKTKIHALEQARHVVENRINELGLTEPSIQVQNKQARIIVQLPGEKDPNRVLRLLKQTAKMEFHLTANDKLTKRVINSIDRVKKIRDKIHVETAQTEDGVSYTTYKIDDTDTEYFKLVLKDPEVQKRIPANYVLMLGRPVPDERLGRVYRDFALIKKDVAIDGMSLKDAKVNLGRTANDRHVALSLDSRGRSRLRSISRKCQQLYKEKNQVSQLAILLDDVIYSAPTLITFIDANPIIKGSFSESEAAELALILRSGALPAKMEIIQNRTVGATLGADSIRRGVRAALFGLVCVVAFIAVYYLLAGLIADLALMFNILILLGVLAFFRATLTLPGIAGIILTIGMAVDANVLIFERIREEMTKENNLKRAIREGFAHAKTTIVDANVTTILTAIILYMLGTGPIRGFALTLIIGIGASMFTALFVSRFIFDVLLTRDSFKSLKMFQFFKKPNIDFISKRYFAYIISLTIIVVGMIVFSVRNGNQNKAIAAGIAEKADSIFTTPIKGIELTGGDVTRIKFPEKVSVAQVRKALSSIGLGESTIQRVGDSNEILIRSSFNSSTNALSALNKTFINNKPEVLEVDRIGPAIGQELKSKAFGAILLALLVVIIYIWWRFEFRFGVAAIIALAHDVLITLGIFALTGHQITLGVIAALLTIVGYSLNDTIVVFDRIREDMHIVKKTSFTNIMNLSINQTLSRTVLTSFTTLVVVLFLWLFGGQVINNFAFALMIGVIVGTYSSIFIASPILLLWQKNKK
ncbi:MAG: hypothetical protein DRI44_07565 [Chlamydiae bacterium]|nr:MAG: hypothetical protein DRI44_07565 [Chlamydiota bacterium]